MLIDELGPGEMLGWSAVMEPYVYTASAWTTEPCEVIVVNGDGLRELCEANKQHGLPGGQGHRRGDLEALRAGDRGARRPAGRRISALSAGEERVIWDNGELQLTTQAVLIGMDSDSPEVIPLEALSSTWRCRGDCVVFHAHGGDVCSPPVDDPEQLAALTHDEMLRTRYAQRRRDYYLGSN